MSRYRKIEVKTWMDEKFCRLSKMPPSGQGLWFYLLTGPHTGPIPGLFRAGREGMAEDLEWDVADFDRAFDEISEQGMAKADFKAKLVWLPNAIRYNKPSSPAEVLAWRDDVYLLPDCRLKIAALLGIREDLQALGVHYVVTMDKVLANCLGEEILNKRSDEILAEIQEETMGEIA